MSTAIQPTSGGRADRAATSSLADVIDTILDKGLVIDAYVRVSLVGIEILTIDVRVVVASVDTYLRFAEAANRLDLTQTGNSQGLPDLLNNVQEGGAQHKVKGAVRGAIEGAGDKLSNFFGDSSDQKDDSSGRKRTRVSKDAEDEEE